jgi:DNA-binding PadR family transcriptional regulator
LPRALRSSPVEVLFFSAMKDGPAYGYELATRFRRMSGGHMRVSYGTIYPLLRRMEHKGLIRSKKDQRSGRVYYELTKRGTEAQERLSSRMKDYQKEMEEKVLGILSMHATIFGKKALRDLLKRVG